MTAAGSYEKKQITPVIEYLSNRAAVPLHHCTGPVVVLRNSRRLAGDLPGCLGCAE